MMKTLKMMFTVDYLKKWLMKQQWRFQYSSTYYSLIIGALNTGALWMIYLKGFIPIPAAVLIPVISISYIAGFLFLGWFLDAKLRLWKEGNEVIAERNPFTLEQPYEKEVDWNFPINRAIWIAMARLFKNTNTDCHEFKEEFKRISKYYDKWTTAYKRPPLPKIDDLYEDN